MKKSLLQQVHNRNNLKSAWGEIRHRPESRGIDDVSIKDFERSLPKQITSVKQQLAASNYKFQKLKAVALDKTDGTKRPLKIPSVRDRVVQKAIHRVIYKELVGIYDLENAASFAYIKDRSTQKAIDEIKRLYGLGYHWMYQGDISKFFDTVSREILLSQVLPPLSDDSLNGLITDALNMEVGNLDDLPSDVHTYFPLIGSGIAQGGVLSPLFANVYLSPFDKQMLEGGFKLVRYADDFIVLSKTEVEVEAAHELAVKILERELKLKLHPLKREAASGTRKLSKLEKINRFDFLGFQFVKGKVYPAGRRFSDMVAALGELPYTNRPLAWNVQYLQQQSRAWGVTYQYTDLNREQYMKVNAALERAIVAVMRHYGFARISDAPFTAKELNRLGIDYFDQAIDVRRGKVEAQEKKKQSSKSGEGV